ncbi:hypothetical protein BC829DRAFT_379126 [Chytridium lagenaria]|nr:hypothetical protein BC829DRAFT_379126 [Chytridium lagenaria]
MFLKGTHNIQQKILEDVFDFYQSSSEHDGILDIARTYGLDAIPPKKKIWVLLLGNHSAGKSSYINWQAINNRFYFNYQVTSLCANAASLTYHSALSGKRRETLRGQATIRYFDCLKDLATYKGVMPFLSTEIVTSRSKNFSMVTFIDTPGLVDGEMSYPFDPEKTMLRLASEADVIFTFFDPIGQALCKRTMNVVEKLCSLHGHKVFFFLSKADTVPDEYDRQRVLIQHTPIFVPENESVKIRNHVNETLTMIESAINMRVQRSLENLEDDCKKISDTIRIALRDFDENRRSKSFYFGASALFLVVAMLPIWQSFRGNIAQTCNLSVQLFCQDSVLFRPSYAHYTYTILALSACLSVWLFYVGSKTSNRKLDRAQMKKHLHVTATLGPQLYRRLYTEYFDTHAPTTTSKN